MRKERPIPVGLSVDVEQDCPPYLGTWAGVEQGLPALLELLASEKTPATFFVTGETARRYPGAVEAIVAHGHELGCHADSHCDFRRLTPAQARQEIEQAAATLRRFAPVHGFRAPYLQFPARFLPLLLDAGFDYDSSLARYKLSGWQPGPWPLRRFAVSITSSWLRLPHAISRRLLQSLPAPIVLFVHPWEMVDFRCSRLRLDCRFRTGPQALQSLQQALGVCRARGGRFLHFSDL